MVNSVTGDGSYSPNITAGDGYDSVGGNVGTVYLDTGTFTVDFIVSGRYGSGQIGDTDGTITVTGAGVDVDVSDTGLYAYSRITVAQGFDSYISTGVLSVLDGATITSTNNAALASGSIPLGGYSNLQIGVDGELADGTVTVSGAPAGQRSSLILNGGSAGFVMGGNGGTGSLTIDDGAYFRTLTGVIGQGNTGTPTLGGMGTVTVDGPGSQFNASTLSGDFLVQSDQAPVIYVGQSDGSGYLNASNGGLITIQNEIGDGKSSPTLIFGDDPSSYGRGDILSGSALNITQYGPATAGSRLNGDSGLIIGNGGVGYVNVSGYAGGIFSEINVVGDRANLVVSRGSYGGMGEPIAPSGQSRLVVDNRGQVNVDSQNYGNQGGATATIGSQRLTDGLLQVNSEGEFHVRSGPDLVGDQITGRLTVGDLGAGRAEIGNLGSVYATELIIGARGYTTVALDNSTDQIFTGYNAAAEGGGIGVVVVDSGSSKIVITGTDNSPDRGITIAQASGTSGLLTIDGVGSYVKSTGGLGRITIGGYGDGNVNITGGGALYGGFITVGVQTDGPDDILTIDGVGSRVVASGVYSNVLAGGVSNGQSAIVEVGQLDNSYGRVVITNAGEMLITNDAGNDQNPQLVVATGTGFSYGKLEVRDAGSAINIVQNGARFLAPSGDVFGGAEAILGKIGYANVDISNSGALNILGDSALLSVGEGGYDALAAPIISSAQSNLTISSGADVLVDSQSYGFDNTASDYSEGAYAAVGRFVGGYGRIRVDGVGSTLTVTSASDFAGDYRTGSLVVGGLGRGMLEVADNGVVDVRTLNIGRDSFYDDGMGGGRIFGGYLPNVTEAADGSVDISTGGQITVTGTTASPFGGIRLGEGSGAVGVVNVNDSGSTLTSTGGAGQILVADFGNAALNVGSYGQVEGFLLEVGRNQGSDGDVTVDGYGSQITISNEFGDFDATSGGLAGKAGTVVVGDQAGSDGSVNISNGAQLNVLNQNGTGNDNPSVTVGRYNGAVGTLIVDGSATPGSITYYSTLSIVQTGLVGDFVSSGGIGPFGPTLTVGEGGQGQATVSNQGRIELTGAAANLNIATGRRDGAGNPDTSSLLSTLSISSDADVVVDSQSYGGSQDFTDPLGGTITAPLGSRVTIGSDVGTNGFLSISGVGSTLSVISANESADDYSTGSIRVGTNGGSGAFNLYNGGAAYARGLNVGHDAGTTGTMQLNSGGSVTITGTDATRYQGISIGRDDGYASVFLLGGSNVTSTGGAGRLQVGRDGGTGILNIQSGSEVNAFFADVGRGAGSAGSIQLDGYGSRLTLSDAFGQFDPAVTMGPRGGNLTVGREDGGNGDITVSNGASLNVINDDMAAPGIQGNGATLTIGRDTGAQGLIIVTGEDGMGNSSYLRVQNYGVTNDGPMLGEYYGPELRLGVDGALGQLFIEQAASAFVVGENAQVTIGESGDGGGMAAPQSSLAVRDGSELVVTSVPNPDTSLFYNAAADIVVGAAIGGNGLLEVSGVGSTVSILSDNATDYYDVSGEISFGAGLQVGEQGYGAVVVTDGGQIIIDGADDVFPNLTIGYGDNAATVNAIGTVAVSGAGSLIQIIGTRSDVGGTQTFGAGGLIEIGVNDGTSGSLTISDGGTVQNSAVFGKTQIARDTGSTGDVTVTGAGSTFDAGVFLTVGAYEVGNSVITDQSGAGSLTIEDQAVVTATSTTIGDTGTLSISDASLTGDLFVTGDFFVGGDNAVGDATIGGITQMSGLLEFDVLGANAGEFDTLTADSASFLSGDAITIDVGAAATLNVGDSAVLFSTTGGLIFDTFETVTFVGQESGPGREFVLFQQSVPVGQATVDQLVFAVQQTTLATVAGDFEIISEAPGLVALTSADINITEGSVDPALQILTVSTIFGGQLESALDPGVQLTSFSQQDVDDRLIRFVSDGSRGAFVELSFTDSSGFIDSVFLDVVTPSVPDIDVNGSPTDAAFAIDGISMGAYFGISVSSAGDINGDGIDDLIVGASRESGDSTVSGAAFVIFGSLVPFEPTFDLSTLDGTNGFQINGEASNDATGISVAAVGDVNGDGFDDLAIGATGATAENGAIGAGKLYILFGDNAPVDPVVSLAALATTDGIAIDGGAADAGLGAAVFGGEDFNGDGVADIVVSAYDASFAGDVFVVFGDDAGLTGPADTNGLDGTNGFRVTGLAGSEFLGSSVSMADLDGDGLSDLVIGASGAQSGSGAVFVVKGVAASAATVDVTTLSGADGFRITGLGASDFLGDSVSSAGDFNGDGIEDIVIAASGATVGGQIDTGSVYVIFGVANGFNDATFDLATLNGTNGFQIDGRDSSDNFGQSVSSVGDMNGDGFDDILVGAPNADPQGMVAGEAYLIFGSDEGFAAQQNVTALTDNQLALFTNFDVLDSAGASTGGGFDLNGDGLTDAIVGGPNAGPMDEGAALIVFGAQSPFAPVIEGDFVVAASQNQSGLITTSDLMASEPDATPADLLYHAINFVGGFIEFAAAPGTPIQTFTQADIDAGLIAFNKDGATETGSFDVTVTDADGDVSDPVTVSVQSVSGVFSFNLSDLDGTNGFQLNGIAPTDQSGLSVSNAGDINGDGFDDVIVGAQQADGGGINDSGETYIVFGAAGGFAAQIELSSLDGTNGFRLTGTGAVDLSGGTVSAAGDVNNDGIDDLLVGIRNADSPSFNEGEVVVIYGSTTPFPATRDLSGFDGTDGTSITGADTNSLTGASLSEAGDVNGDGIDDFIIGSPFGDTGAGADVGESYVVFGADGGLGASLDLTTLDGTNGFRIEGSTPGFLVGLVGGIGDINDDGFADLAVSSQVADPASGADAGITYIVFGGPAPDPVFNVSTLNGANGFAIDGLSAGDQSGRVVSSAGDINNDGVDDFMIGAFATDPNSVSNAGSVYVVFGQDGGPTAGAPSFDLASLDGTNGFEIQGVDANDRTGYSISNIGDFDGDGVDDILISADAGDPFDAAGAGEAYIVFGSEAGFDATLDLSTLDGTNGLRLNGIQPGDSTGRSLSAAGDVNNDGRDDIIIGAFNADPDGLSSAGQSYVIFGFGPNQPPIARDDDFFVFADVPVSGDLFADNGDDIDEDVDGDPFALISVNGSQMQVGTPITLASGASVLVQSNGLFDYDPTGAFDTLAEGELGADAFTYTIGNADGEQSTASVNLLITGVNEAPVANNDLVTFTEDDVGVSADLFADNGAGADFDVDNGDTFLVTAVDGSPVNLGQPFDLSGGGRILVNSAGAFLFNSNGAYETLAAGETTSETFTYTITDSLGAESTATVNLDIAGVNDAPEARDDSFQTDEDTAFSGDLFANSGDGADFDIDSPTFTVTAVNGDATNVGAALTLGGLGGVVTVRADGTFDYTPSDGADVLAEGQLGAETFTYQITDDLGAVSTASVIIALDGLNDAPVANDDVLSVSEDDDLTGSLFDDNGFGADFDIDNGDTFTVISINGVSINVGQPVTLSGGGEITVRDDGAFLFATNNAYEALAQGEGTTETFTYTIADSVGGTSTATVNLDIIGANDPPAAQDDNLSITEGDAATFNVIADNGNGVDSDTDNDQLRISGANGQTIADGGAINFFTAQGLAVTIDSTGALTLNASSPALRALGEGEQLVDSFIYLLEDEFGLTDTGQVNVRVTGVNDTPVAANDFLRTDERTALTASVFADNGAGADRDVDGDFTVTGINGDSTLVGSEITLPSGALLTITADGAVSFDPNGAFLTLASGEQAFEQLTYTVTDDQGATAEATLVFAIDGVLERVFGSSGDDLIRGTDEADDIDGLGGNDLITGLDGNDTIKGGLGLDIIRGGADDDSLVGGPGKDRLFGEAGDDRLEGGGGNDRLLGLTGNDTIFGNDGDDILSGGRGNDFVSGQAGDDRLRGGRDSDTLIGGDGKDRLQGGTGDDSLFGQDGNDNLTGAGGADTLSGGDGIDRLFGRRGSDELTGGQGGDRFIFNLGDGSDTITDFEQGLDKIRIASGAETFADLAITQVGDDALIAFGNVRILALDEDANDFTISDFIL